MNRSTFALFVAVLIHLLFILLFWKLGSISIESNKIQKEENKIKISLKELPKKYKKSGDTKKTLKQDPKIAPPMPKGSQLEKIVKKQPIEYKPNKNPIEPKLNPSKETEQKLKTKPIALKKPFISLVSENNTSKSSTVKKENSLYSMLSQDKSTQEKKQTKKNKQNGSSIRQDVKELYGEEFGKLSQGQQEYILDNQEIMRRITQQVLTRVARVNLPRDLNINRSNVIEFYLHPNGDMTDFKFLQNSGYYILDDTTKETIEYAYSRYPRPSEKTLIRYNVYYNLARY